METTRHGGPIEARRFADAEVIRLADVRLAATPRTLEPGWSEGTGSAYADLPGRFRQYEGARDICEADDEPVAGFRPGEIAAIAGIGLAGFLVGFATHDPLTAYLVQWLAS